MLGFFFHVAISISSFIRFVVVINSNSDQVKRAIKHLITLWKTKCQINRDVQQSIDSNSPNASDDETTGVSKMELFLRQKEIEMQSIAEDGADEIANKLHEYSRTKRCALGMNPIEYWSKRKASHKESYELSMITNSVPITQVSVERAFSSLAFILNPLRNSLAPDTLENILVVRLNKEVFLSLPLLDQCDED